MPSGPGSTFSVPRRPWQFSLFFLPKILQKTSGLCKFVSLDSSRQVSLDGFWAALHVTWKKPCDVVRLLRWIELAPLVSAVWRTEMFRVMHDEQNPPGSKKSKKDFQKARFEKDKKGAHQNLPEDVGLRSQYFDIGGLISLHYIFVL